MAFKEQQSLSTEENRANETGQSATSASAPSAEECKWAAYAHQSILWMWFVYCWFGALVATTILMEMFKSKSPYVAFHARQCLYLQLVVIAMVGPAWVTSKFFDMSDVPFVTRVLLIAWTIPGVFVALAAMIGALSGMQRTREGDKFE